MSSSSTNWCDAYMSALDVRDSREKANASLYEAYTKLADHTATLYSQQLESGTVSEPDQPAAQAVGQAPAVPPRSILGIATLPARSATPPTQQPPETQDAARLRADLATAQKSKSALTIQLSSITAQLAELRASHDASTVSTQVMSREKAALERRLKDRDSELREKRSLLENVQDEVVGLEMQVNVAEQEVARLKAENAALVKRLVENRELEVERLNRESGWVEER